MSISRIPEEIAALAAARGDACVSISLPTTPLSQQAQADRIALKHLSRNALQQLQDRGVDKRRIAAVGEQLDDLIDDYEFWRFQAHSLAIFATPENLRTFGFPTRSSRLCSRRTGFTSSFRGTSTRMAQ